MFHLLLAMITTLVHLTAVNGQTTNNIGLCYGQLGNNLPSPSAVVALYKQYNINKMRIFHPDSAALDALRCSNIEVVVGTRNDSDIFVLAESQSSAQSWFSTNIQNYLNDVTITHISVGNEVFPNGPSFAILPAMQNLQAVISAAGLHIKVTTSVSTIVLENTYPPSSTQFLAPEMAGIVEFLQAQNSELLANVYPYYAYVLDVDRVSLDFAQFAATSPVFQDGNLTYFNLFDAILDGFYWAMEKVGAAGVGVVVTETGWPHDGGTATSIDLARTYNKNFVGYIQSGKGTPKRPNSPTQGFIFAAFDENQKSGADIERFWGVFNPNGQPNYNLF